MSKQFHLSVVATSRNDNHGGSLTYRMQHFVDGFVQQCRRHQLKAELILVEWNPPADTAPLTEELHYPSDKGPCAIRIIRVPQDVHMSFEHGRHLPLFQMIAKNVGIRRALGDFVLATNIDILFSDELMSFMRNKLQPGVLYRADRLDVPHELPRTQSFDELLQFCRNKYFRINGKQGTIHLQESSEIKKAFKNILKSIVSRIYNKRSKNELPFLHTNGCGDFTLLSYEDWAALRGYPEWPIFSFHIDSVLLYQAHHQGIKERDLPKKMAAYHIEHSLGSGYSAEGANLLFKRLEEKGIPYLNYSDLLEIVTKMRNDKQYTFNKENWGLNEFSFQEQWV